MLEFDNIANEFVYLENIIINVHSDILVHFTIKTTSISNIMMYKL